jgi:citrate synthase
MKIGKSTVPKSSICTSNEDTIVVRGQDLCEDLIGVVSFADYFHLLVTGKNPDRAASVVLNATLVAIAEHGMVPSVQASRMTYAAAPDALQGAVAAGILGCGSVILGASEAAGRLFKEIDAAQTDSGSSLHEAARKVLERLVDSKKAIPGYGHPLHKARDPRVDRLIAVAKDAGADMRFVSIAHVVEELLPELTGKQLKLNVSAAIPAVLLGIGFPVVALKGVPILARTAGLIAHLTEESEQPIGFALSYQATLNMEYEGPVPAGFRQARE